MSLLFIDSFENWDPQKWVQVGTVVPSTASTGGIHGNYLLLSNNGNTLAFDAKSGDAHATYIVGFYLYMDSVSGDGTSANHFVSFWGNGRTIQHISVNSDTNGAIVVRRGPGNGTNLVSSSAVLTNATWYHVAVKVTISDTVGKIDVEVDGDSVISTAANLDTSQGGNNTVDAITIDRLSSSNARYDDLYICNGAASGISGIPNNDFLGVVRADLVLPDSDTATEDWTLSTGADSFALIDEATPNGDTDYISSDVTTDKTQVGMAALPGTVGSTIFGVQVSSTAKMDAAGSASYRNGIHSNTSDANGADNTLTEAYLGYADVFQADPDGGAAWTSTKINAAEVFVENRT